MLVCFTLWTACSALYDIDGNLAAGKVVILFIFLHGIFYNIAWSGLLVGYTVEIMPYKLRAKVLCLLVEMVKMTKLTDGLRDLW